ncbi:unnamed protein product [Dovyalis caffra]|uniref:IST1-like protein n=1 Tax=Dovyalis caffra TaxID=77055 RepID=A0AAV1R3I5_9ROSI|nr:unnamed protein product [Dovyalis caffra]
MWSTVLNTVLAWTKSSRWRRDTKCKRLTEQLQVHLAAQKLRRESMIRQSRANIAQLLQNGRPQQAMTRVQLLYKDQCLMAAYDQINQLCECIITNMPHVRQQCTWQCLPIDVSQAISNLIFAASRCGDLPELQMLRNLFKIRYGIKFETTNVELLPGNLVDSRMKENLSVNSVPENVKLSLINGIADEYNIHLGFQGFGRSFRPQWQEKAEVLDLDIQDIWSDSDEGSIPASKFRTPPKTGSHYDDLNCISSDSLGRSHINSKRNEVLIGNLEASVTSPSSCGTLPIHEKSYIYLGDLEVKSWKRSYSNCKKAPRSVMDSCHSSASPSSVSNVTKRPAKPRLGAKPVPPPSSNDRFQIPVKDRRSFDSSIDEWKVHNGSLSSHVHPKLPNYEDVVAKFTDIKAEYRHRKSFYY